MIDLDVFCARSYDLRKYLQRPWVHKGYTYACNGHVLVRVPCPKQLDADATEDNPLADKAVDLIAQTGKAAYIPLPAFPAPKRCLGCGGDGRRLMVKCEDCGGDGYFEHGRYEYECKECDGDGFLDAAEGEDGAAMQDCPECGGIGFHHSGAPIGDSHFSTVYLRMLSDLPGLLICTNGDKGAHFTFDGGDGVLMPRRADV